jgi:hypothetical protein
MTGQIVDWKVVRRHILASKSTPKEIKSLLVTFVEAGDLDITLEGTSWVRARPSLPAISDIEMLTDTQFRGFTIRLPVEERPFAGPPYGYCAVDIDSLDGNVYLKCLASWYPPTKKLDLDAKLLATYLVSRIRSQLEFILERLPK